MATIIVHGGAAPIAAVDLGAHEEACRRAVARGLAVLAAGGTALAAAVEAVVVLEDDPVTNAGTGAVLNQDGQVEMDALAMEGTGLGLGAVAGMRDVKNPIKVAEALVARPDLNMLIGEGASRWAEAIGIPRVDPRTLVTAPAERRWRQQAIQASSADTVGAVVADDGGRVAAAVSTGGILAKTPGRVGDAPLVGSGGYADDQIGAAVATGVGEAIMRVLLARAALHELSRGLPPPAAARAAIELLRSRVGGRGGVIVVDPRGRAGWAFNTPHMSWGHGRSTVTEIEVGH